MPKFLCTFNVPGPAEEMLREVYQVEGAVNRSDDGTITVAATRSL